MLMPRQAPSASFIAKGGASLVATISSRADGFETSVCGRLSAAGAATAKKTAMARLATVRIPTRIPARSPPRARRLPPPLERRARPRQEQLNSAPPQDVRGRFQTRLARGAVGLHLCAAMKGFGGRVKRRLNSRAPPRVGARAQTAAMRLDDPPTDGKAHPRALRFCCEECVEDALGTGSRCAHAALLTSPPRRSPPARRGRGRRRG